MRTLRTKCFPLKVFKNLKIFFDDKNTDSNPIMLEGSWMEDETRARVSKAVKIEGWYLQFYVFDGLKAISRALLSIWLLVFSSISQVVKIPHTCIHMYGIVPPKMTIVTWSRKRVKSEGEWAASSANSEHLLSYPRFIMKILLIYVMKLCQL